MKKKLRRKKEHIQSSLFHQDQKVLCQKFKTLQLFTGLVRVFIRSFAVTLHIV